MSLLIMFGWNVHPTSSWCSLRSRYLCNFYSVSNLVHSKRSASDNVYPSAIFSCSCKLLRSAILKLLWFNCGWNVQLASKWSSVWRGTRLNWRMRLRWLTFRVWKRRREASMNSSRSREVPISSISQRRGEKTSRSSGCRVCKSTLCALIIPS